MLDALDMQVRLSALQEATKNQLGYDAAAIVERAATFYNFLTGTLIATGGVVIGPTVDPLPLAGEPPIETGAAAAATEAVRRTRRTKAEMEAARAAESPAIKSLRSAAEDLAAIGRPELLDTINAAAEATAAGPAPADIVYVRAATVSDVKAAFMRVVETEGLGPKAGSALIKQFGVERISMLPEKDFAAAVAACDAAVAEAGK